MYADRIDAYRQIEQARGSKLLVFATSNRDGVPTQIASDILPFFTEHLDVISYAEKISLLLITNGGDTMTAWNLVNLIKSFCSNFEVIVPFNCFSAGTLICLGANNIVMTKQATLGPIDPSTNGPLNPIIPGTNLKVPVSVEFVNAYIEMARKEFQIHDQAEMAKIMLKLTDCIHPLVLGQVYRSRNQIQMVARKLISSQNLDHETEEKIIKFLCSDSGSHDYAIHRREAREELGLNIETPTQELYDTIKHIYKNISQERELEMPFRPETLLGANPYVDYECRRILIESVGNGTDVYVTKGRLENASLGVPEAGPRKIVNNINEEKWNHEN